jgi:hypothetical protein
MAKRARRIMKTPPNHQNFRPDEEEGAARSEGVKTFMVEG